jgi:hypothetical protein
VRDRLSGTVAGADRSRGDNTNLISEAYPFIMTNRLRRVLALVIGVGMAAVATGVSSIAAAAAALPSVVTGPPSGVVVTEATLSGDVDPNGAPTTYDFEYGTGPDYGLQTTPVNAGAGVQDQGVAARLDGLTPGTTYYYRLVARSSAGASYGSAATFHTPAHAPTIETSSFADVGDSSATVTAAIEANGLASTWYVRYGTSGAFGLVSPTRALGSSTGPVTVSMPLRRLVAHTSYYVQVVATNAAGTSFGGQIAFATTGSPSITAQSIRDLTPTSVTLVGALIPDGHATRWYFQYGTSLAYGANTTVGSAGSGMGEVDVARGIANLSANTPYYFRLVAVSADGTVVGADVPFETPGPSLGSSSSVLNFGTSATLSGNVPSGAANENVAIYGEPGTAPSFVELATVLTGTGGNWAYVVQPGIGTTYKVIWHDESSPSLSIAVSPSVTLREPSRGRFVTHVAAASSLTGRVVRLQRLEHGLWRTVAARQLNRDSSVSFRPSLPAGRSRLRVYLTAYQAGAGYLAALSGVHSYKL